MPIKLGRLVELLSYGAGGPEELDVPDSWREEKTKAVIKALKDLGFIDEQKIDFKDEAGHEVV